MNRQTLILLSVLLAAAALYFVFIFEKGGSSFSFSESNFSVEDTAAIDKMVLTRVVQGEEKLQLVLEKQSPNEWKLNGKYPAFQPRVGQVLETLFRMRIKEPLSEKAQETGVKFLETLHTRLDIYEGTKKVKSILIGTQTKDAKGTVMMLEGERTPYVLEIPGVPSYLNVYFPMELNVWRENLLFNAQQTLISEVSLRFDSLSQQRNIRWLDVAQRPLLMDFKNFSEEKKQGYFALFKGKVFAETFATVDYPGRLRVLKQKNADVVLEILYLDGNKRRVHLYERQENSNNYFAWVEGQEELLTVQKFVIDKFLRDRLYFVND